ncbi:hypothetical protein H8E07_08195 [bacterium]|nr:hypothetical protein [bacterium]
MTRRVILFLLATGVALMATTEVLADFRHTRMGARPRALGSAFVSLSDDPNATLWNPAGLTRDNRLALMASRAWMYSVSELSHDYLTVDVPAWHGLHFGASFVRLGIHDVYYEDVYHLAVAAEAPFLEGLSVGATGKIFRLTAPGYEQLNDPSYDGGDTGFAADIGFHYDSGEAWTLGGVVYNLNEPYLQLLSTTIDPDPVYSQFALGGSYLFRDTLTLICDLRSREGGWDNSAVHLGAEIWFFDAMALRSGLNAGMVTMGVGLQDVRWQADIALETHNELGNVYLLSFTVRN